MNNVNRLSGRLGGRLAAALQPLSLAHAAGALAFFVGSLSMLGWATGTVALIRVLPGLAPMKPNTALCFMLCGVSLCLQSLKRGDKVRWVRLLARACAALVALVGTVTLAEHFSGWNPGVDLWMFPGALKAAGLPQAGRMTHAASLNFTLLGFSLLFLDFEPRRGFRPAQHAALLSSLIGLVGLLVYAYGVPSLYGFFAYSSMALHTAFTFTFLGLGVMMARPDKALMAVVTSPHGGGITARRVLPAAVLLPTVLGWFRLKGELAGWYDTRFGLALFATANIITFVVLVWFSARSLNRIDSKRRRTHDAAVEGAHELRKAYDQLQAETAEHQRTEDARRKAEGQLQHAQKMEALGTLAGGIAHDFNNILAAVYLHADRARKHVAEDHPARRNIDEISKAGTRAADLVRRIMTFSRQGDAKRRTIRMTEAVEDSLQLLSLSIPPRVELLKRFAQDLPPVAADATQIHQILLNLGSNALHALGDQPGVLEVTMDPVRIAPQPEHLAGQLKEGLYVRLAFSDNGKGMDKAVLDRIFDPFFTTKPAGVGTGLGLPVVHGIMKQHEGAIMAYSEPGRGTRFNLYFPAAEESAEAAGSAAQPAAPMHGRGERLLCVDDNPSVLSGVQEMLEYLGYAVTAHESPDTALAAFHAAPHGFDLLLTDFAMPGMSGLELARKVLEIRPELPVVLASGYLTPADHDALAALGVREILLKPNVLEELGGAIRRALDRAGGTRKD
jgi:signal transduction histidine kinase/ActR/RegA family two-component response regulator